MLALFVTLTFLGLSYAQAFSHKCQNLVVNLPNVKVDILQFVPNGTNLTFPDNDPSCTRPAQLIYGGDICRVAMNVSTSNASSIILEAWLPSNWNGRFLSTGNGGLGGCIQYEDIAYAASYNFAAVGANNGHNGTSGRPFLNSPGSVEDFAYRSIHTGVVVGKQLTQQFYASSINHSYYLGCSTGGRQGMISAQRFPDDFDGIIAGAPAFDFNHLIDWSFYLSQVAGFDNTSTSFLRPVHWNLVNAEIVRQCDTIDGAKDGIIENSVFCQPALENLLCTPNITNTSTCLNPGQYARAVKSLEPLYNASGTLIYPRLQPGAHAATVPFMFTGSPFIYSSDWYKYVVYNNPNWNATSFSQSDITTLDRLDPYGISTWSGNLSKFASRGGKILTYHGQQDQLISGENTERYYSHLAGTMGLRPNAIDDFYRFFRIGGMQHCTGGPGAWDFGQRYRGRPQGVSNRYNNALEAIIAWVEQGQAPDYVEGIKWVNDNAGQGIAFKRKHCRYPRRNVYMGSGNGTDEDGWKCVF